jgi:methylenetetrahydrofolate reductase (NADPH)
MKVTEHINQADKPLFSLEILPPKKGQNIKEIYSVLDPLVEHKPSFVNVTYHREEVVYKPRENGLLEQRSVRKRPGTVGICAAIMNRYQVDAIPHIICGGFTQEETENALIDLDFLGIDNVLVLRGDPIKNQGVFIPEKGGHRYASELLEQVVKLNEGKYLEEDIQNNAKTNFCLGVAGYPEKHFEAPNMKMDLHYLKQKVDCGADYIVTQMFFDNKAYFDFVKRCRENDIHVPIIPGIKPLASLKQLQMIPHFFHINYPEVLVDAALKCKSDKAVYELGIEWAIQQSNELIQAGVPCLHYYTMGKGENVLKVTEELF